MFSSQDVSRNVARIVQKYEGGSPKGRFADQEFSNSVAGLPPTSVLRVADPSARSTSPPRFARAQLAPRNRPASVPEPQMPHEWQYTLAKPVSVKSSRAEADKARAEAAAARSSGAAALGSPSLKGSVELRNGWKGKKLSAQAAKRKGKRHPKRGANWQSHAVPSHQALAPSVKILQGIGEGELGPWGTEEDETMALAGAERGNVGKEGRSAGDDGVDVKRMPTPRDPYSHVESVLVRSGLIPKASSHTTDTYGALPEKERTAHQLEARRILRDTMHPIRHERHAHQVSHVTMNVLSDKVWVMEKLGDYSTEVEKQIASLRHSPAHMYQWMAETRDKQAEIQKQQDDAVNHNTPAKPFGVHGQRRMAPTRGRGVTTQVEAMHHVVPQDEGHPAVHAMFSSLERLQDHLDARREQVTRSPANREAQRRRHPPTSLHMVSTSGGTEEQRQGGPLRESNSPPRNAGMMRGVMERHEVEQRLIDYFHGNAALAGDCLEAVWQAARPLPSPREGEGIESGSTPSASPSATKHGISSFPWAEGGNWQVVPELEVASFPGTRPNTTHSSLPPQPSFAGSSRGLIATPQSQQSRDAMVHGMTGHSPLAAGNFRSQRLGDSRAATASSSQRWPVTALLDIGRHQSEVEARPDSPPTTNQPSVPVPLEAPQWHHILFPASQPALKRNVDLVEGWVTTMVGLLDIKLGEGQALPAPGAGGSPAPNAQHTGAQDTSSSSSTFSSDFEALFLVYAVAYLELVRQVTVQSAPRGEFMLRIWHAVCRLIAGIFASVDQQLLAQDERTRRSFQDGYAKGQTEASSGAKQWKAKCNAVTQNLATLRDEYDSEKARLEAELSDADSELKQAQAELDALRMRIAECGPGLTLPSTPPSSSSRSRQRLKDQLMASTEDGLKDMLVEEQGAEE